MSLPLMRQDPEVGWSRAPMMFIMVLFPEPEAPMIATYSPLDMSRWMSLSASTRIGVTTSDMVDIDSLDASTFSVRPVGGQPILGSVTFGLRLHDVVPGALAVFGVGAPASSTPLLVQPFVSWIASSNVQGEHTLSLALPVDPAFHGVPLFAQAGALDPAGTFFGFALTQGLRFTLCQ